MAISILEPDEVMPKLIWLGYLLIALYGLIVAIKSKLGLKAVLFSINHENKFEKCILTKIDTRNFTALFALVYFIEMNHLHLSLILPSRKNTGKLQSTVRYQQLFLRDMR